MVTLKCDTDSCICRIVGWLLREGGTGLAINGSMVMVPPVVIIKIIVRSIKGGKKYAGRPELEPKPLLLFLGCRKLPGSCAHCGR